MQNSCVEREVFLDWDESIRTSVDSASSYFSADEDDEFKLRIFNPESWMGDMKSVQERRQKFLCNMGFEKLFFPHSDFSSSMKKSQIEISRLTNANGAALDSFSATDDGIQGDCIRNLDNGKEFEELLGFPCSVHKQMDRKVSLATEKQCDSVAARRKHRSWWRRILNKKHLVGMCEHDVTIKNSQLPRTIRTNGLRNRRRSRELTGIFIEQEIRAHVGSIRALKFSPSRWYIASGGEDSIVRIWQIKEAEATCKCEVENSSANSIGECRCSSLIGMKDGNRAPVVFPKKAYKILEKPRHEFHGHTGEILDLSWSSSNQLLTASIDKTVRLWKVGCDGCLQVFLHNDYVTCIQFNPVDERYFISGSIDGKVRIWSVLENHVFDWVGIRDIVTAVCYRPDGKGFVVGSINGNCRFYDYSRGNSMHLYMQFPIEGKQKSAGKRVTGLQYSPDDTEQIMITSADSRVRIFDGFGVAHKFRGLRRTRSHASASFTSDGRHIISVGEDSNVYIWNYDSSRKPTPRRTKSIRSSESFFSKGVSVAVPWPDMDHKTAGPTTERLHLPSPIKILGPSAWFSNSECFFLGCWLFADSVSRVGPAEKLPVSSGAFSLQLDDTQLGKFHRELTHHYKQLTSLAAMCSMRIVTASSDGFIRSFHNFGLPVWS
ncbi:WD repeat-containing protein AAC3-like isoform X2 [Phalaenopsis equestris]|uniref:WD repeat-containing protein AAC3-like isoform X2 n=1 Tax=Phalaenopsis equestris TaxID=78828 RepID=UPI0009E4FBA3|nr:WD repeat-containing protein AAC3-like isoform X2 [Phalaenopsis equestris]